MYYTRVNTKHSHHRWLFPCCDMWTRGLYLARGAGVSMFPQGAGAHSASEAATGRKVHAREIGLRPRKKGEVCDCQM